MRRALAALGLVIALGATPSGIESAPYHGVRYLMGTWCDLTLFDASPELAPTAAEAAFQEIARLERVLSTWDADSELSHLNRAAGSAQRVSRDLINVTSAAIDVCRESSGAFDPTVGALLDLWQFNTDHPRRPSPAAAAAVRASTGCERISFTLNPPTIALPRGASLDFGGIGKGYAVDRAIAVLRGFGITRAKIDFGSSSLAFEGHIDGGWPVVLADPRDRETPLLAFRVDAGSISSSGQAERSIVQNGRRYGHIFDPKKGEPVQSPLLLVSVAASTATRADALSTALFVMGSEKGMAFVKGKPGLGAVFIEAADTDRVVIRTAGRIDQLVRLSP